MLHSVLCADGKIKMGMLMAAMWEGIHACSTLQAQQSFVPADDRTLLCRMVAHRAAAPDQQNLASAAGKVGAFAGLICCSRCT